MPTKETPIIKMAQFLAEQKITMLAKATDRNPPMEDPKNPMDHWRCSFRRGTGKSASRFTTSFSMGKGHNGKAPEAGDVLDCLASDASSIENAKGFEDWANDMGWDSDSRKAEKIFNACKSQAVKLKEFLGDESYQELLWNVDRL